MKKKIIIISALALLMLGGVGFYLFEKYVGTVSIPSKEAPKVQNNGEKVATLEGFDLPEGFSMNIFAKDLQGARAIELDPKGRILVSQPSKGKIVALIDANYDGVSDEQKVIASELKKPHGMAFKCEDEKCFLYVAESNALSRFLYDSEVPSLGPQEKLMDIASSVTDRHTSRSLLFLPAPKEDTLLISVGSSCDVCVEENSDYASVIAYNTKTGEKTQYAKGLRNATFMTLDPVSGRVFATEMGRDNLGDDLPPDEINIIEQDKDGQAKNYGWPICYGKNIHDVKFDKNVYMRNPCMEPFETPSFIDLQAHSAPLGLAFIPEEGWPEEYWYNLLVAYHGSWNRSQPTGYKIARIKMNAKGEYLGTEDFISGWLTEKSTKIGRPVDIKVFSGGTAYISDDNSGLIYRLFRNQE